MRAAPASLLAWHRKGKSTYIYIEARPRSWNYIRWGGGMGWDVNVHVNLQMMMVLMLMMMMMMR